MDFKLVRDLVLIRKCNKEKILKIIASNYMKYWVIKFCLGVKISCFSKVHNIFKIRWFMLGFNIHALFYDLYMFIFQWNKNLKTLGIIALMLESSCDMM